MRSHARRDATSTQPIASRIPERVSQQTTNTEHPWAGFFVDGPEPPDGDRPTREEQERALRLGAAARTPAKAAALVGLARDTFFRICRGDGVHRGTLAQFRSRIEAAEKAAEPIWREHMLRLCGLPADDERPRLTASKSPQEQRLEAGMAAWREAKASKTTRK